MSKGKKVYPTPGRAHLIGICGAGMSALAILLKEAGWKVTGSDEGFYEPISGYLKKNKIPFSINHKAKNIPAGVDMIVIGKHAKLVPGENAEVKKAFESGVPVKSLPEVLAMLSKNKNNIVVAGSFGKSTSTSLISYSLMKAKKDPSYFIGAVPINFAKSSHLGRGKEFVLEGDEYPSSNWDNKSKFLHLAPTSVLLISALHDHINVFPTEKSYVEPYKKLIAKIRKSGLLVYSKEGKNTGLIKKYAKCRTVNYSLKNKKSDWYAKNIKYGLETSFSLVCRSKTVTKIKTKLLGNHNLENIIGAGAILLEQKLVKPNQFTNAMQSFAGIKRRIELKTKKSGVPVYEGFGSSYEKAKVIFDALKLHFPKKRIVAVFEPHTFSWRNRGALKWYRHIFDDVSEVILLPPPPHGASTHDQLSFDEIYNEIKNRVPAHKAETEKEALTILKKKLKKNDILALVSSGSLLGLSVSAPKLAERLF